MCGRQPVAILSGRETRDTLVDRVALRDGRLLELAPTEQLFETPGHGYTRELLAGRGRAAATSTVLKESALTFLVMTLISNGPYPVTGEEKATWQGPYRHDVTHLHADGDGLSPRRRRETPAPALHAAIPSHPPGGPVPREVDDTQPVDELVRS